MPGASSLCFSSGKIKIFFKKGLHFLFVCDRIQKLSDEAAVGVDYGGGPPVPIPNTEVKPVRAEDTWLATARDNRFSPTQKSLPDGVSFFSFYG
jgi:hypothetical protein